MRSKFTGLLFATSMLLAAQAAFAESVEDKFRLMEQRLTEMEDRLHATSDKLEAAEERLQERDATLVEHGLLEAEEQSGLASAVGSFFESVDISGVAAASYNHRLVAAENHGNGGGGLTNVGFFKNPNANTFQLDQIWLTMDKAPTEESRGGFHAEFMTGVSTQNQGANNGNPDVPYLYAGYVSYLLPFGGIQVDLGKLPTVFGAEVIQTDGNYFITQGSVFGLQPVTYNGLSVNVPFTDEFGFTFGVVNDVYSDTSVSIDNDKAYFGQFSYGGDVVGLNVGGIIGNDDGSCDTVTVGKGASDCLTSVVDVVLSVDPTDNLSFWANYDWRHTSGSDTSIHGDAHGISGAGRLGITEDLGIAARAEYIWTEDTLAGTVDDTELFTLTGTFDATLAEGLVTRVELRWDTFIEGSGNGFQNRSDNGTATNNDQLVALWQIYYAF